MAVLVVPICNVFSNPLASECLLSPEVGQTLMVTAGATEKNDTRSGLAGSSLGMTDCAKFTAVPGEEEGKGSCEGPGGLHGGGEGSGGPRGWVGFVGRGEGRGGEGGRERAGL